MSRIDPISGGRPIGYLADFDELRAAAILYLRLWSESETARDRLRRDFVLGLGPEQGQRAGQAFDELVSLCVRHGRRPLLCHAVTCDCVGTDESCFANFIATATEGEREDAMLIATLIVRADIAPLITSLAVDVGLSLKRMHLAALRSTGTLPRRYH